MSDKPHISNSSKQPQDERLLIQEVLSALRSIRFGSIEITVHEGKATLIERKEKVRLNP